MLSTTIKAAALLLIVALALMPSYISNGAGAGGTGCIPAGSSGQVLSDDGAGACSSNSTAAGILTFLGTPSSANLATAVTNETGSGALVFATSPTLVTPALGTPASGVGTNITSIPNNNVLATSLVSGTSLTMTAPRTYGVCTGTCTVTVPVPAAGYEFCIMNSDNVATAITLSALGSSAMYENSARTAYGTAGTGTLALSAAAANKVCLLGLDSTHYLTVAYNGTVTVN